MQARRTCKGRADADAVRLRAIKVAYEGLKHGHRPRLVISRAEQDGGYRGFGTYQKGRPTVMRERERRSLRQTREGTR